MEMVLENNNNNWVCGGYKLNSMFLNNEHIIPPAIKTTLVKTIGNCDDLVIPCSLYYNNIMHKINNDDNRNNECDGISKHGGKLLDEDIHQGLLDILKSIKEVDDVKNEHVNSCSNNNKHNIIKNNILNKINNGGKKKKKTRKNSKNRKRHTRKRK